MNGRIRLKAGCFTLYGARYPNMREKITERMKRGQMQKLQGRPPIGVYHYGYDYDPNTETISINKREAKVVKHIYNSNTRHDTR